MSDGCNIRFDENDDLVIDDIPDDMMEALDRLAKRNGRSVEEEMRLILFQIVGADANRPSGSDSPLP